MNFGWQEIDDDGMDGKTHRGKVPGGWIVKHEYFHEQIGISNTMVFVPDPNHEWEIEE